METKECEPSPIVHTNYHSTLITYLFLAKDVWGIVDDYLNFGFFAHALASTIEREFFHGHEELLALQTILFGQELQTYKYKSETDMSMIATMTAISLLYTGMFPFTVRYFCDSSVGIALSSITKMLKYLPDIRFQEFSNGRFVLSASVETPGLLPITLIVTDRIPSYLKTRYLQDYILWERADEGEYLFRRPQKEPKLRSARKRRRTEVELLLDHQTSRRRLRSSKCI